MLKVLYGDHGDSNVEYNRAAMDAGDLLVPTADGTSISFTICSASMVEAFTTGYSVADMFSLYSRSNKWGSYPCGLPHRI